MAAITNKTVKREIVGPTPVPVFPTSSLHTIHVSGSTGDVTVTVVPDGFQESDARNPGKDGENVFPENGMIQIEAGALSAIILTPANSSGVYSVSVSSQ